MKAMLSEADAKTLVLIDEFGSGTEPAAGGAIAEAILAELDRRGVYGLVTTHYTNLKLYAAGGETGVINGAMLFDTASMRPLYRLATGLPGSSFAFEIAANIGFPKPLLDAAGQKVGHKMLNFEHQLQQIELDKREIARKQAELDAADSFLNDVVEKYQALLADLEARKREIIAQARTEARDIIAGANRTVEQTISDIKKAQAEKQQTIEARERLKMKADELATAAAQAVTSDLQSGTANVSAHRLRKTPSTEGQPQTTNRPITVGDIVKVADIDSYAQVVELKGRKAVVESNSVRMTIALDRLVNTVKKELPPDKNKQRGGRFQSIYDDLNEKRKHFNPTLDLRGHRAEEALTELQHFLDDAQLLGERELRILHGKGYGILKTLIREQLQANHDVKSFHAERIELGGDGITVVHL